MCIAIRRITMDGPPVILSACVVDGNDLGYIYQHDRIADTPKCQGYWSRKDGCETTTALKFVKPDPAKKGKGRKGAVGKVVVHLYRGEHQGIMACKDFSKNYQPASTNQVADTTAKKELLTIQGQSTLVESHGPTMLLYARGAKIDVITLNYCSAVKMVTLGVIPQPSVWEMHRLIHPVQPGQLRGRFKRMKYRKKESCKEQPEATIVTEKEVEIIDLTDDNALPMFT